MMGTPTSLFGGIDSVMTMRKTVIERRVVIPKLTFSPLPGGITKPRKETNVMSTHGRIMLKT